MSDTAALDRLRATRLPRLRVTRRRGWLALLGPGLITGASDDDPSGIATYSQAGAAFGFAMCWVMLFTNILNLGADLGAMGDALALLIGGSSHLYVVIFAVGCVLLEVWSRYHNYVSILKWTSFTLFAYVATALTVSVPWSLVAWDTFVPNFSFQTDYVVAIVAVLGTTITPYCFFWQSSQEAEDERGDPLAHA